MISIPDRREKGNGFGGQARKTPEFLSVSKRTLGQGGLVSVDSRRVR
jgi:hypothetical protein